MNLDNASTLEIMSTLMMGTAFIGSLAGLVWLAYKYYYYRRPNPDSGKRANGAAQLIFAQSALLHATLCILTGMLFALSVLGMFTPPAIRPQNQQQNDVIGSVYIACAVLVAMGVVANLWLTRRIESTIRGFKSRMKKGTNE